MWLRDEVIKYREAISVNIMTKFRKKTLRRSFRGGSQSVKGRQLMIRKAFDCTLLEGYESGSASHHMRYVLHTQDHCILLATVMVKKIVETIHKNRP